MHEERKIGKRSGKGVVRDRDQERKEEGRRGGTKAKEMASKAVVHPTNTTHKGPHSHPTNLQNNTASIPSSSDLSGDSSAHKEEETPIIATSNDPINDALSLDSASSDPSTVSPSPDPAIIAPSETAIIAPVVPEVLPVEVAEKNLSALHALRALKLRKKQAQAQEAQEQSQVSQSLASTEDSMGCLTPIGAIIATATDAHDLFAPAHPSTYEGGPSAEANAARSRAISTSDNAFIAPTAVPTHTPSHTAPITSSGNNNSSRTSINNSSSSKSSKSIPPTKAAAAAAEKLFTLENGKYLCRYTIEELPGLRCVDL